MVTKAKSARLFGIFFILSFISYATGVGLICSVSIRFLIVKYPVLIKQFKNQFCLCFVNLIIVICDDVIV